MHFIRRSLGRRKNCRRFTIPISGFVDAKIGKRNCYKEYFEKFMARKPGIHGHKQLLPHKSWYNYPNHLSIKLTQNNKEALSNDNNRHRKTKKAKT